MRKLVLLFVALMLSVAPTLAQSGPGIFVRSGTSSITSPVIGQTYILDYSGVTPQLKVWNGSAYQQMTSNLNNFVASGPPTVGNDQTQGYTVGSFWFDTVGQNLYICTSAATGAATWAPALANLNLKYTTADDFSDWLVTGLVASVPGIGSLTVTTPGGTAYVLGIRITPGASTYTYTALKDTYDFLQTNGSIVHTAVANGGGVPSGTGLLIQKVVTNGSVITAITALAPTAPLITVGNATTTSQALNESVGDVRYTLAGVGGTVTSFSAGNLSPLLTTSVATSTTTPVLSFSFSNFAAGTLFGNATGSSTSPAVISPGSADQVLGVAHTGGGLEYKSLTAGSNITITPGAGSITIASSAGGGGVTSAAFTGDGVIYNSAVTGSPITTTGTFAPSLHTQSAATLFGVPGSSTAAPSFFSAGTANQVVGVGTGGNTIEGKTITAGTGITVTPSGGAITIATSSSSSNAITAGLTAQAVPNVVNAANGLLQPLPFDHVNVPGSITTFNSSGGINFTEMCSGPDGRIWATDGSTKVYAMTPGGTFTLMGNITTAVLNGIAAGPDGRLWMCDSGNNKIQAITTGGSVTAYTTGLSATSGCYGIAAGPDGRMWFTEGTSNKIGAITATGTIGTITEYSTGIATSAGLAYMAAGPDGRMWFTEQTSNSALGQIGAITTAGTVTEYHTGITGATGFEPEGITAGADGRMWFVFDSSNTVGGGNNAAIGAITTTGTITNYILPSPLGSPWGICAASDGTLWFNDSAFNGGSNGAFGQCNVNGSITETALSGGTGAGKGICAGSTGDVFASGFGGAAFIGKMPLISQRGSLTLTQALGFVSGTTNPQIGTGTLASGTATISNTSITANSAVVAMPTSKSANSGVLSEGTLTAGASVVINSSNASDANTFFYIIFEKR